MRRRRRRTSAAAYPCLTLEVAGQLVPAVFEAAIAAIGLYLFPRDGAPDLGRAPEREAYLDGIVGLGRVVADAFEAEAIERAGGDGDLLARRDPVVELHRPPRPRGASDDLEARRP